METSLTTREQIKSTFLQLSEAQNYRKVSATEVCKAAGINRSTFYFYFESIDRLLNEIEFDFIHQICFADCYSGEKILFDKVLKYAEYVRDNRAVFFVLVKNGRLVDAFLNESRERGQKFSERKLPSYQYDTFNMLSSYTTVGHVSLLETWLTFHPDTPPEKVAHLICQMAVAAGEIQRQEQAGR